MIEIYTHFKAQPVDSDLNHEDLDSDSSPNDSDSDLVDSTTSLALSCGIYRHSEVMTTSHVGYYLSCYLHKILS